MSDERPFCQMKLTWDEFKVLWDRDPYNPRFIREACLSELYRVRSPYPKGTWPKYGVRVYHDVGFNGSGYLMVHWDDADKVPGCQSNGYMERGGPTHEEIEWDDQPEIARARAIRRLLREWSD